MCYLQVLLADLIAGVGRVRIMADMDAWGYSFRLGSTRAWFEGDAEDAREWLVTHKIIDQEPGIIMAIEPADGDWKQDKGYEIMARALAENDRIDLVYAHNDPMAFGAYLAAKDEGRDKDIFFLGIDGIPGEGTKWVSEGILTATFLYDTPGDEGIQQVLRILAGAPIAKRITLPTMTIDKGNARDILLTHGLR